MPSCENLLISFFPWVHDTTVQCESTCTYTPKSCLLNIDTYAHWLSTAHNISRLFDWVVLSCFGICTSGIWPWKITEQLVEKFTSRIWPRNLCRDIDVRTDFYWWVGTKLVMISDLKQSHDLRRLNEASSLFSYRVIQSNSLVEAIEYELSLYSYC